MLNYSFGTCWELFGSYLLELPHIDYWVSFSSQTWFPVFLIKLKGIYFLRSHHFWLWFLPNFGVFFPFCFWSKMVGVWLRHCFGVYSCSWTLSFSTIPLILTFNFKQILGTFFAFMAPKWPSLVVGVWFKHCLGVYLFRCTTFVFCLLFLPF